MDTNNDTQTQFARCRTCGFLVMLDAIDAHDRQCEALSLSRSASLAPLLSRASMTRDISEESAKTLDRLHTLRRQISQIEEFKVPRAHVLLELVKESVEKMKQYLDEVPETFLNEVNALEEVVSSMMLKASILTEEEQEQAAEEQRLSSTIAIDQHSHHGTMPALHLDHYRHDISDIEEYDEEMKSHIEHDDNTKVLKLTVHVPKGMDLEEFTFDDLPISTDVGEVRECVGEQMQIDPNEIILRYRGRFVFPHEDSMALAELIDENNFKNPQVTAFTAEEVCTTTLRLGNN